MIDCGAMQSNAVALDASGAETSAKPSIYTRAAVALHCTPTDCWVIVRGNVYDVSRFAHQHPGGVAALTKEGRAGCDVTEPFERVGHSPHALERLASLKIGSVAEVLAPAAPCVAPPHVVASVVAAAPADERERTPTEWHAARRVAILRDHPEVAKLQGTNPCTPLIGAVMVVLHSWCALQAKARHTCVAVLLAATVGAWCKMCQFAVCHDICHGTAGKLCRPFCVRHLLFHLLTLPSFGGETQQYYAYQHLGHHASLGAPPPDVAVPGDSGLADNDGFTGGISLLDIDGDLPAPNVMILFAGSMVEPPKKRVHGVFSKLFCVPCHHLFHFLSLSCAQACAGICCCGPLYYALVAPILACGRLRRKLGCASPETAEFVHASAGLALHAWVSWSTALLVLFGARAADDVDSTDGSGGSGEWYAVSFGLRAEPSDAILKGLLYLLLSELFLHGFCFHPYLGYFLGVHRSRGEGFGGSDGVEPGGKAAAPRADGVDECQPTMSTYGPLTSIACMNLNYHVEHHDFPTVPWSRLPAVHAAAPEYYDHLEQSPGFTATIWRWFVHGHGWKYACSEPPLVATGGAKVDFT